MNQNLKLKDWLFIYKILALLHDPPNKAFLIISGKDHEEEAKKIISGLFEDKIFLENFDNRIVKEADIFAATIDRYLLNIITGNKIIFSRRPEIIKLKNIFNPQHEEYIYFSQNFYSKLDSFLEKLKNIISLAKDDIKLAYFLLYAFYELIWINENLPISPADTRVPTHSVFDHNYATATAINFYIHNIYSENPEQDIDGLAILIDIGGVQNFISNSRKLRDLWASSYMISALVWYVLSKFINLYGPDILILPTARFNPFFYHLLLTYLFKYLNSNEEVYKNILKSISEYLTLKITENNNSIEIKIYDYEKGFPRFAVIPATATFVLPSLEFLNRDNEFKNLVKEYLNKDSISSKKDIEDLVYQIIKDGWKKICESIDEISDDMIPQQIINEIKKHRDTYDYKNHLPFNVRVIVKSIKEIKDKIKENYPESKVWIYDKLFEELTYQLEMSKILKIDPISTTNLTKITEDIYKENISLIWDVYKQIDGSDIKKYEYCSLCGKLPSIIQFPTKDKYDKLISILNTKKGLNVYFGEGEKLCFYCAIKRLFSIRPKVFLKKLLNSTGYEDNFEITFPSTLDIAIYDFIDKLTEPSNIEKFLDKLKNENMIGELRDVLLKYAVGRENRRFSFSSWIFREDKIKILKDILNIESGEILYFLLISDSENIFFNNEDKFKNGKTYREFWNEVAKELELPPLNTYYALIKSDGDNLGKLLGGRIEDALNINIEDYIIESFGDEALGELARQVIKNKKITEEAKSIIENLKLSEKDVEKFMKIVEDLKNKNKIIISLSYHSTISKVLMITALIDTYIIENKEYSNNIKNRGFVVYAGGDDLLAVSPVSHALRIIKDTRKTFSFGSGNFFYNLTTNTKYLIPAFSALGRSYVLYITNYKYPLYSVIEESHLKLEELSKNVKIINNNPSKLSKDSLTIIYASRGKIEHSILPFKVTLEDINNKNIGRLLEFIGQMIEFVLNKKISMSSIYDLNKKENIELLNAIIKFGENANAPDIKSNSIYLFTNNIMFLLSDKSNLLKFEKEPISKFIKEIATVKLQVGKNEYYLYNQIFKGVLLILKAL